jgi:Protein of unknown function (DUF3352)
MLRLRASRVPCYPMLRKILLAGVVAVAIAGCGSSSGSSHAQTPLATALSYFPTDTPFVIAVTTNPNSSALQSAEGQLTNRFPEATLGIAALEEKLQSFGLNYDSDIKPLFGNPILLGAVSNTALSAGAARDNYLFSWVASSASGLKSLVSKLTHTGSSTDTRDGASLYPLGAVTLAVDGATALIGPPSVVNAALDTHAHDLGFTQDEYASDTSGLPQSNLMEAFGNLTAVLSRASAAKARQVPWVNAIRSYGAAISTSSSGITFQYRVNTNGSALSASQVPIAAGSATPDLVGTAPVSVGINDPAQIVSFALAADQAVSPSSYAAFEARMAKLKSTEGIDLQSLTSLLTGSVIIAKDGSGAIGRATVSNPTKAASVLAKLASAPHGVFKSGTAFTKLGGGFYQIKKSGSPITLGVTGNQLVLGKATVAQEKAFAAAPTTPASFAHGSVAFQVALSTLLRSKLSSGGSAVSAIAQTLLSHLGNLTGWLAATPSALTGSATLALH